MTSAQRDKRIEKETEIQRNRETKADNQKDEGAETDGETESRELLATRAASPSSRAARRTGD